MDFTESLTWDILSRVRDSIVTIVGKGNVGEWVEGAGGAFFEASLDLSGSLKTIQIRREDIEEVMDDDDYDALAQDLVSNARPKR